MDVRIQSIHFDASEQLQAFIQFFPKKRATSEEIAPLYLIIYGD